MIRVYGDIMLDRWIIGKANRISPEAPVPILKEKQQKIMPGGAANLAVNIANLNGDIATYGSVGNDKEGFTLIECLEPFKNINFNIVNDSECTTVKNRLVGQGGQHIMRWDREIQYKGAEACDRLIHDLNKDDIVCVSDYNKGTVQKDTITKILKKTPYVLVDPKQDPSYYKGAWLVKPNMSEWKQWFIEFHPNYAHTKMIEYGWEWLIVTDGARGLHVLNKNGKHAHYKEEAREVADVTGAGDTVLAVLAYCIEQGKDVWNSAKTACFAAARAVEHRGVHVVTPKDLNKGVVFTNGVFDILHAGHLQLLKQAKQLGNKLIVGVNTDSSVQRLKGSNRPINDIQTRIAQLEALPWVDQVLTFTEDTPIELIRKIQPDLIVKGGDYTVQTVVGHDICDVKIIPLIEGYSTTKTIEKMNEL